MTMARVPTVAYQANRQPWLAVYATSVELVGGDVVVSKMEVGISR
jgi:hypothetical protein